MYQRIKSYGKPLILDEVGTTAVNFKWDWSMEKVKSAYENDASYKNAWFDDMRSELSKHPELRAVMYFNRDKTSGLTDLSKIGELDWAGLSLGTKKEYASFLKFFDGTNSDIQSMPFAWYSAKKESLTVKGSSVSMTPSGMTSSIAANPYTQSVQAAINNFIKKQSSISSDKQKIAQKLIVIRDKVSIMKTQKEKSGKYTSSTKNLIEALIDALDTKVKELSV